MISHLDINEHDVDVLITENGVTDLRGLDDLERAQLIIERRADSSYRNGLEAYLNKAGKGHHPVCLSEALWRDRLIKTGSMLA